jgi:hypothetical protein
VISAVARTTRLGSLALGEISSKMALAAAGKIKSVAALSSLRSNFSQIETVGKMQKTIPTIKLKILRIGAHVNF